MSFILAQGSEVFVVIAIILIVGAINLVKKIKEAQARMEQQQGKTPPARPAGEWRAPADEIQQFLEEVATRAGGVPPRAQAVRRPRPPATKKAPPRAQRPRPRRPKAVREEVPVVPLAEVEPVEGPAKRWYDKEPKVKQAAPAKPPPATALDRALPADPLQRAMALRYILGPCRAQQPYKAFEW